MNVKGAARDFPVVCVGGSAGGLDAYTRLLRYLPSDMGVAIVIVNHLRTVATHLHEILPHYTDMPVEQSRKGWFRGPIVSSSYPQNVICTFSMASSV
jgi:chemotaxis response regulator CheB